MMPSQNDKAQLLSSLSRSVSSSNLRGDNTQPAMSARSAKTQKPQARTLEAGLRVTFFFDGTGNNLDADLLTGEHSNVARLFQVHFENSLNGVFRYYIPGLGTYFKDVDDPGDGMLGNGSGYKGEARLQWAMSRLKDCLAKNDGRQTIHLALFGFSRGSALARAFALRVVAQCKQRGDGAWRLTIEQRTSPIRLYFMGLFDTVASVGAPMSMNNAGYLVNGLGSEDSSMKERNSFDLQRLAVGPAPGADPAPGVFNGHMDWASDLHIPEMVEDCLHMVAAHEFRNSFPVDSLLEGPRYPSNCREMVYPGSHSDVGGGYRVGEGARSRSNGALLSMISLRVMREQAIQAGVPLKNPGNSQDFAEDGASRDAFELLDRRFTAYMDTVGWGSGPLGKVMLSHTALYYQWRFHKIARNRKDRDAKRPTKDESLLREFLGGWIAEKKSLLKQLEPVRAKYAEQAQRTSALKNAIGAKGNRALIRDETAKLDVEADQYFSLKARLDTMPSTDSSFLDFVDVYDAQLLEDAKAIQRIAASSGRANLRPHYLQLLNAYEAEQRGQGLKDMSIIQFFDTYVHDSLAGFAKDATLPSDPRVIYTGGDAKLPYALNRLPGRAASQSALG